MTAVGRQLTDDILENRVSLSIFGVKRFAKQRSVEVMFCTHALCCSGSFKAASLTRIIVCRVVLNSRASSAMLAPSPKRATTVARSCALSAGGRPNCLPAAFARTIPDWVRSISRSRSNSATAAITCMVILPAGLVRSTPPRARQCTRTPELASCSTVDRTSIALRPSRSSLVTTSTSPDSIRSINLIKPGRSFAATEPLMLSSTSRRASIANPAATISNF